VAYDEALAERVRAQLDDEPGVTERKMFGGIAWMLEGNMAVGLISTGLLVRLGPEADAALEEPHASPPMMGSRVMKGFVVVAPEGVGEDAQLAAWIARGSDVARSLPPK
jgi:TfoX/Sxy family transcriptional regulator of competence genes